MVGAVSAARWTFARSGGGVSNASRWALADDSGAAETCQRPAGVCFPGGGLDEGEDQETTLVREMQEELGTLVEPIRCVWHHRWPDRALTLWGWLAELKSTTLTPNPEEVHEILWLNEAEALRHPMCCQYRRLSRRVAPGDGSERHNDQTGGQHGGSGIVKTADTQR